MFPVNRETVFSKSDLEGSDAVFTTEPVHSSVSVSSPNLITASYVLSN